MKWMIRKPKMLEGIKEARFAPNTVITLLIGLLIFFVYIVASIIVIAIYFIVSAAGQPGGLFSLYENMYVILASPATSLIVLGLFAVLGGATIIYVRCIQKRPLASIGLSKNNWIRHYGIGASIGLVLLIASIATVLLQNPIGYNGFSFAVLFFLIAFIVQTAAEEIFFRGFLMTAIADKIGVFWAVLISTVVFALGHIVNPGMTILSFAGIFLMGIFFGLYVCRTNNLWGACGMHLAWNFTLGLFAPIELSNDIRVDYAAFPVGDETTAWQDVIGSEAGDIVLIVLFVTAIALMLFAGKNRLVVRREQTPNAQEPPSISE